MDQVTKHCTSVNQVMTVYAITRTGPVFDRITGSYLKTIPRSNRFRSADNADNPAIRSNRTMRIGWHYFTPSSGTIVLVTRRVSYFSRATISRMRSCVADFIARMPGRFHGALIGGPNIQGDYIVA
jgi:hypothetical protein